MKLGVVLSEFVQPTLAELVLQDLNAFIASTGDQQCDCIEDAIRSTHIQQLITNAQKKGKGKKQKFKDAQVNILTSRSGIMNIDITLYCSLYTLTGQRNITHVKSDSVLNNNDYSTPDICIGKLRHIRNAVSHTAFPVDEADFKRFFAIMITCPDNICPTKIKRKQIY